MPMTFKNYDPSRVVVTFRGILLQGFADGAFVSTERSEDAFSASAGAAGDVTRVRSRNRMGSVTVTLMAASPSNDSLSAVAAQDEAFGTGYGPLMIKDLNGTTLIQASTAWIKKVPSVEFGKDASSYEWVFECADMIKHVGGATF